MRNVKINILVLSFDLKSVSTSKLFKFNSSHDNKGSYNSYLTHERSWLHHFNVCC